MSDADHLQCFITSSIIISNPNQNNYSSEKSALDKDDNCDEIVAKNPVHNVGFHSHFMFVYSFLMSQKISLFP